MALFIWIILAIFTFSLACRYDEYTRWYHFFAFLFIWFILLGVIIGEYMGKR